MWLSMSVQQITIENLVATATLSWCWHRKQLLGQSPILASLPELQLHPSTARISPLWTNNTSRGSRSEHLYRSSDHYCATWYRNTIR